MDIRKILGEQYREDMTAAEIETALATFEPTAGYIKKDMFDKTASELASAKKQLKEKMTADEQAEAERKAREDQMEKELAELKRDKMMSEMKAKFLGLGYDETLASETATALTDGNMDAVFQNQKKFIELLKKEVRAAALKETPKPETTDANKSVITKEKFDAMTYTERAALFEEDQELYNRLNGGNE